MLIDLYKNMNTESLLQSVAGFYVNSMGGGWLL